MGTDAIAKGQNRRQEKYPGYFVWPYHIGRLLKRSIKSLQYFFIPYSWGGKVVVKVTGSAQGTATACSGFVELRGIWTLQIGPPAQTQVWTDGTSSNYGGATIVNDGLLNSDPNTAGSGDGRSR